MADKDTIKHLVFGPPNQFGPPTLVNYDDNYEDELVTRCAPRWAWDIIDETLSMDAEARNFDPELRGAIRLAIKGMSAACEGVEGDYSLTRADAQKWGETEQ